MILHGYLTRALNHFGDVIAYVSCMQPIGDGIDFGIKTENNQINTASHIYLNTIIIIIIVSVVINLSADERT